MKFSGQGTHTEMHKGAETASGWVVMWGHLGRRVLPSISSCPSGRSWRGMRGRWNLERGQGSNVQLVLQTCPHVLPPFLHPFLFLFQSLLPRTPLTSSLPSLSLDPSPLPSNPPPPAAEEESEPHNPSDRFRALTEPGSFHNLSV